MEILVSDQNYYTTLQPIGEIDAHSSILLDEKLQEVIDAGSLQLHIDCSQLDNISSAGLGVIISKLDLIQEKQGKLILSRPNPTVMEVFELLGLNQLMKIVEDEEVGTYFQKNESLS